MQACQQAPCPLASELFGQWRHLQEIRGTDSPSSPPAR